MLVALVKHYYFNRFLLARRISRARLKTPPLAPLTNRQSDSEEQLADVEAFVAQLQAKRQAQAEEAAAAGQPLIGPQMPTTTTTANATTASTD